MERKKKERRRLSNLCGKTLVCIPGIPTPERVVFPSFCRSIYVERVAENGSFGGCLPSTAVVLVCMSDGREDKLVAKIVLGLCCPFLRDYVWEGKGARISLLEAAALLVCLPTDLKDEYAGHCFLLRFCHPTFVDWVGRGEKRVPVALNLRGGAFSRRGG